MERMFVDIGWRRYRQAEEIQAERKGLLGLEPARTQQWRAMNVEQRFA
jgi:hypothetical protein